MPNQAKMRRFLSRRAAGFTLIELLVVIAIISLLAAVLFPVFARAREKARQAACLSNTRQIAFGLLGYAQDYDEMLPLGGYFFNRPGGQSRWFRDTYPYTKSVAVYNCPDVPDEKYNAVFDPATDSTSTYFGHPGPNLAGGYGINFNLIGFYPSATQHDSETLATIKDAAGTFLVSEAAQCGIGRNGADIMTGPDNASPIQWTNYQTGASDSEVQPPTSYTSDTVLQYTISTPYINTRRRPIARHGSGLNIIYCDGHAKWMPVEKFLGIPDNGIDPVPSVRGWRYGSPNNSWDNL